MSVSYLELAVKKRIAEIDKTLTLVEQDINHYQENLDRTKTNKAALELERDELVRGLAELDG